MGKVTVFVFKKKLTGVSNKKSIMVNTKFSSWRYKPGENYRFSILGIRHRGAYIIPHNKENGEYNKNVPLGETKLGKLLSLFWELGK
jgi:hypothetical protein